MASGLTTLDPRTAATSKFVEEKIQKGELQPNQVVDFLLQMGADPRLASLVFKYQKVEQAAKNQMQGQPSTTNVDQDISNQYAQLKQRERMRQGLGGMSAPAIANAAMQGGITGEPVRRMAAGGPIAFSNGGRPPRTFTVDPEGNVDVSSRDILPYEIPDESDKPTAAKRSLFRRIIGSPILRRAGYAGLGLGALSALLGDDEEEKPKAAPRVEEVAEGLTDEDIRLLAAADNKTPAVTASGTGAGAIPAPPKFKRPDLTSFEEAITAAKGRVPKDRQTAFAEEMAREEELGETKAIEARRKELAGQKEKATTSPDKKFWLAFAQAGFAASAKGARNLWETLSMGGIEGLKAYETMKEKEAQTLEKIADKELQLNSMSAAIKRGAMERGDKRYDNARKDLESLQLQHSAQQVAITNAENTRAGQIWSTQATIAGADRRAAMTAAGRQQLQKLENQYYADIAAAQRTTDPKLKAAYLRRAEETYKAKAKFERAESGYQSQAARLAAEEETLRRARGQGADDGFSDLGVE